GPYRTTSYCSPTGACCQTPPHPPWKWSDSACACWTGSSKRTVGSRSSRRWRRSCNGSCPGVCSPRRVSHSSRRPRSNGLTSSPGFCRSATIRCRWWRTPASTPSAAGSWTCTRQPTKNRAASTSWATPSRPSASSIPPPRNPPGALLSSVTLTHLETLRAQGPVVIVARSRGQVDRLKGLFLEHDLPAEPLGAQSVTTLGAHAPYALVQGELSGGLLGLRGPGDGAVPLPLSIIAEDELFAKGGRHKAPSLSKSAAFLKSLEEVKVGDYVVHVQHGIGRYLGLRRLAVQGFESD